MPWTLSLSASAIHLAGANVNAAVTLSGGTLAKWSDAAEASACNLAREDVVTNFGSLTAKGKEIFEDYCSNHIAKKIIGYEPEAVGSSATLRLNIIESNLSEAESQIKDKNIKTYLAINS